ncbi:UPF0721 transmembrane protein YjnA [Alicyclobacillus cellulosilyticus]|uniref:Probable membrane transporter protein n=1 Tax=Alicyclobacillus cellulosilyticus TaxID=1003997 RepID=A0A917KA38_9BACL|nr:sulfite exporter TauE/SafE family protein [Alicyclobacillus cellulosilyticus]GGJ05965.1 UPF0721 transmembrane protein YjnA [Alicyclobacillus cellulosilyticus]
MSAGVLLMGLLVGFLVGLTGVGAASLLTPFLVLVGVHPTIAVGSDLVYNSVTKLFGTVQHGRQKTVLWPLVWQLAAGSVPGALVAIGLLHLVPAWHARSENIVRHALGYVLILVALATLVRVFFGDKLGANRWQEKPLREKWPLTVGIGFLGGFLVGLTSIGSGSLFAIALLYFYRLGAAELVGTDVAHAFVLSTAAGLANAGLGHVDYRLVLNLILGSVPGVLVGSRLAVKVPSRPLRAVMSLLILASGLKLV